MNNVSKITKNRRKRTAIPIRDASVDKTMQANGITYEEATKHVYDALRLEYAKKLMKIYIKDLRFLKVLNEIVLTGRFGNL